MNYEKLYNLDMLDLAFYTIERQMRAAAFQLADGSRVVPASVWYNDAQRLCLSLSIEHGNIGHAQNLTPGQIAQYFGRHDINCDYICLLNSSLKIYDLYGAIMFELIKKLSSEKTAHMWLEKWHSERKGVLFVVEQAAAHDKFALACLRSIAELEQPEPLQEFSDVTYIQEECARVVREAAQTIPEAVCRKNTKPLPDKLHEPTTEQVNRICSYCAISYKENQGAGGLHDDLETVYSLLKKPRGKKEACRYIKKIFEDTRKVGLAYKSSQKNKRAAVLTWRLWINLWGEAFGVSLPYRKEHL